MKALDGKAAAYMKMSDKGKAVTEFKIPPASR
jgi:hypothetical protein